MKKAFFLLLLVIACMPLVGRGQVITTVAGTGTIGYTGDNGPAINAKLRQPSGVILDKKGNLYFADAGNSVIRKIDTSGIITTIAGTGSTGYNGDSILATDAKIYGPWSIAIDDTGNIFVADVGNNRIRKIDTFGFIFTVAGTGTPGYNEDGIAATAAELNNPSGIAIDTSGNIYIADFVNNRIRMVNASGIITTIAGTGTAGFSGDNNPATSATLYHPYWIAIDKSINLFFTDEGNSRVRKFNPNTDGIITTIAGNATVGYTGDDVPATSTSLNAPSGVTLDKIGNLYIGDATNNRIRRVDTAGIITTIAGNGTSGYGGDNGSPLAAELKIPVNVAIAPNGNIYIADADNNRIRLIRYNVLVGSISSNSKGIITYPNPTTGKFTIQTRAYKQYSIDVRNVVGEKIYESISNGTITEIDISNQPAGLYFVYLQSGEERVVKKVVVE